MNQNAPQIQFDPESVIPPYEQIRSQLADLIRSGVLAKGQSLPPLRHLAADLGLAVGTTARAYKELESEGLIHSRRGGGTKVAYDGPTMTRSALNNVLRDRCKAFVHDARVLGADDETVRRTIESCLLGNPRSQ